MLTARSKPKGPPDDGAPHIGISQCLLGDAVRFDGGHKRDTFLTDVLGSHVEWVSVCPEVEAGLGVPREPIRLVSGTTSPRLMTVKTGIDYTEIMERFSEQRVQALEALHLCGYVFKHNSPSCGLERVRVYNAHGMPARSGIGAFARTFMTHFPLVPVEEEGRLNDPIIRENFIERIFCYRRWQDLRSDGTTRAELIEFHTRHKMLLLAHSRDRYQALGRLVAEAKAYPIGELARRYGTEFMQALKVKVTARKHVNVLHHIIGYFSSKLDKARKRELHEVIEDYHQGLVPLIVPITLIKHYVGLFEIPYLEQQVYLNPHPKELMLRNHV
ncbi:MAG: DUF1722 domain-containing protein [Nitrospirales bacterium]|nr:DUF1722 domain-containing protein [Nitrospirales bacterium]